MKTWHKVVSLLTFLCFLGFTLYRLSSENISLTSPHVPTPYPSSLALGSQSAQLTNVPGVCHEHDGLPDSSCTPGAIDTRVTQDNIATTICTHGYTKTVRPPVSYTDALKRQQILAYGYTDINIHDYEEDHLIPLEVGGNPTDPKNLWPEPGNSPNAKDKVENLCNQKVCSDEISLQEAQKEIATDWKTACR